MAHNSPTPLTHQRGYFSRAGARYDPSLGPTTNTRWAHGEGSLRVRWERKRQGELMSDLTSVSPCPRSSPSDVTSPTPWTGHPRGPAHSHWYLLPGKKKRRKEGGRERGVRDKLHRAAHWVLKQCLPLPWGSTVQFTQNRQGERGLLSHFYRQEKNLKLCVELCLAYSSVRGTYLSKHLTCMLAHLILTAAHEVGTVIIPTLEIKRLR